MREQPTTSGSKTAAPFRDAMDHLLAEMGLIRLVLAQKAVQMARRFEAEMESTFRGYGITPAEAMEHLRRAEEGPHGDVPAVAPEVAEIVTLRTEASLQSGLYLPLVRLARVFSLTRFERSALLTCLLPEFLPGMSRVFGFLQDDATLLYPTVGFLMELYCRNHQERECAWPAFHPGGTLKAWRLIVPVGEELRAPPLRRAYRVDERIVTFLMGSDLYDGSLEGVATIHPAGKRPQQAAAPAYPLESLVKNVKDGQACTIVSLLGTDRDGAWEFVEMTARELGWRIIKAPVSALVHQKEWHPGLLESLLREAVLQPACVLLYEEDPHGESPPEWAPFLRRCAAKGTLIFHLGRKAIAMEGIEPAIQHMKLVFNAPGPAERLGYWQAALEKSALAWPERVAEQLAMRYPYAEPQVNRMIDRMRLRLNGRESDAEHALDVLNEVITDTARKPLHDLAQRIQPVFQWNDLIVHKALAEHLKAFRDAVAHQFTVYEKWGLGAIVPRGRGVVALFSGPSGTGKTMAAEVIAKDLRMDLYRIDLAGLVSKYIGETEKNIRKVFDGARGSNVLLFFDEADALFGRRTEIQDSHDRYANLEVNYLLQRLEEHEGPVILATNKRKNMDEAFLRRIHFIVEFPQPSEPLRQLIWQKHLPLSVPRSEEIDLQFLAKHFEISGGDIKNAALQAAFAAAEDGGGLSTAHLLAALKREYLKLGKVFPGSQVNHLGQTMSEPPMTRRRKKEVSRLGS